MADAWELIVQQEVFKHDLRLLCSLLCTSKSLAATVVQTCAGHCSLERYSRKHSSSFLAWLAKHARLLEDLEVGATSSTAEQLALCLQQASAPGAPHGAGLLLQSVSYDCASSFCGAPESQPASLILQQLPANHLTSLALHGNYLGQGEPVSNLATPLAALTALRHFEVNGHEVPTGLLPALSGLNQLTEICVAPGFPDAGELQCLPPQLLVMSGRSCDCRPGKALQLGHLTALTELNTVFLRPGIVLPPNVQKLELQRVAKDRHTLDLLLPLHQLRSLSIWDCPAPAEDLLRLSALTNLMHVTLQQCVIMDRDELAAGAPAWGALPIRTLLMEHVHLTPAIMANVGQCSSLTRLHLFVGGCHEATPAQMAAAVQQLSQLQQLSVRSHGLKELPDELPFLSFLAGAGVGIFQQQREQQEAENNSSSLYAPVFMAALAKLPRLQKLSVWELPNSGVEGIAAVTQLTGLVLEGCGVTDASLAAIARSLTGLQSLCVKASTIPDCHKTCSHRQISDAVLPVIAHSLNQLTQLQLDGTRVTPAGVQCLSALMRLQVLGLFGTPCAGKDAKSHAARRAVLEGLGVRDDCDQFLYSESEEEE